MAAATHPLPGLQLLPQPLHLRMQAPGVLLRLQRRLLRREPLPQRVRLAPHRLRMAVGRGCADDTIGRLHNHCPAPKGCTTIVQLRRLWVGGSGPRGQGARWDSLLGVNLGLGWVFSLRIEENPPRTPIPSGGSPRVTKLKNKKNLFESISLIDGDLSVINKW